MKRIIALAAAGVLAATAFGAQAATYDAVSDFGSSVFSYGSGTPGGAVTALTYTADNCVGTSGLSCYNDPTDTGQYTFPVIGKNNTSGTLNFYTNTITPNELFIQAPSGSDAILTFTAPTTGLYNVSAVFARADTSNGSGDGVTVGVFSGGSILGSQALGTTLGSSYNFSQQLLLTGGSSVEFYLNPNSNIYNDGTALTASISAAPEPGVWALMIAGLAMMGGALRLRRRQTGAVAA